jgi:hypothetical protein
VKEMRARWIGKRGYDWGELLQRRSAARGIRTKRRRRWRLFQGYLDLGKASGPPAHACGMPQRQTVCSCARKRATEGADGLVDGGASSSVALCCWNWFWNNYETTIDLILQITHKFSKEVEKLPKQKLLNFSNPTTFSITTFSNFGLDFEIWIWNQKGIFSRFW